MMSMEVWPMTPVDHHNYFTLFLVGGAFAKEKCHGWEIVDPKYFFPLPWTHGNEFYGTKYSLDFWKEVTASAFSIDNYASSTGNTRKILRPKYYGASRPLYSYLGPKFCPSSYFSDKTF